MQHKATLRVCASCEWIFKTVKGVEDTGCPKCGFAHYSAKYVYDMKAYTYQYTQQPWFDKKMSAYAVGLYKEIDATKPKRKVFFKVSLPEF